MTIQDILKPEEMENLTLFSEQDIEWLNARINIRQNGKLGVECVIRGKNDSDDFFELGPEEVVRQLLAHKLIEEYGYAKEQLEFEVPALIAGKEIEGEKRIDIAVYPDANRKKMLMVIEVKRPEIKDENKKYDGESSTPRQQMESYCLQRKASIGAVVNGGNLFKFYLSPDFEHSLTIDKFPNNGEDIKEWAEGVRFTLKQLMLQDRLQKETLKEVVLKVEQRFGANTSPDTAFDEIFKLIFTKLYDEKMSSDDADVIASDINRHHLKLVDIDDSTFRTMEFRAKESESANDIFKKISELFSQAQDKWKGVFPKGTKLEMQPATAKSCVKELQNVKLFNSNLEVIDEAFEYLVNGSQKKKMGQYFTPRYVIDMCVKMLNPNEKEKMIDTAAGSCGFPMHTIFHVWQKLNPSAPNLFSTNKRTQKEIDYVNNNVFGIDFSEKSVRVGRMLNIIAGDGQTNILYLNSLDYRNWRKDFVESKEWDNKYHIGFQKLEELANIHEEEFKAFNFDVLMANPPFAGDLDNEEQLDQYDLSLGTSGKRQNKMDKDILFIERNLNFLKPGGRMAIVLPQSRFNNDGDKYVRDYILERCRLLAVIGLHANVFKPHTATKTSVLVVQKWTSPDCGYPDICPKPKPNEDGNIDYPIFFATMQEPSKDNSGNKNYVEENYLKWTNYSYVTERHFYRNSDGMEVPEDEYNSAEKKTKYKVKIITKQVVEEHKNDNGSTSFIKSLFLSQYGNIEEHRHWQMRNIEFCLKNPKVYPNLDNTITLAEYLMLSENKRKLYKESPLLGKNNLPQIDSDHYSALSTEERKYYSVTEEIKEWTERVKDTHGHIFVRHDLFNHDPKLDNPNPDNIYSQNGIAEAFAKFAYDQHLSFAPTKGELDKILNPFH